MSIFGFPVFSSVSAWQNAQKALENLHRETRPTDATQSNHSEPGSQASLTMSSSVPLNSSGGVVSGLHPYNIFNANFYYNNPYGLYSGGGGYHPYNYGMYGQFAQYAPPMPNVPMHSSLPPPPPPPLPHPGCDTSDSKPVAPDEKVPGGVPSNVDHGNAKDVSFKTDAARTNQQRPVGSSALSVPSSGSAYASDGFYSRFSAVQGYTSFENVCTKPAVGPKIPTSEAMSKVKSEKDIYSPFASSKGKSEQETYSPFAASDVKSEKEMYSPFASCKVKNENETYTPFFSSKVKSEKEIYSPFAPTGFDEAPSVTGKFKRFGKQAPDAGAIRFNLPKRNNMTRPPGKLELCTPEPRNRFEPAEQGHVRQQSPRAFMQQWKSVKYLDSGKDELRAEDSAGSWQEAGTRERVQRGFYGMEERLPTNGAVTPKWQTDRRGEGTPRASRWDDPVLGDVESNTPVKTKAEVSSEAPGAANGGDWPPPLKLYVQRCFASVSDDQKDEMEQVLKDKLTVRFKSGSAINHNWDAEPLPRLPSSGSHSSTLPSPRRWEAQPDAQMLQNLQSNRSVTPLYKFSAMSIGGRGGRRGAKNDRRTWSPPGFRRRSRSRSRSKSRSSSKSKSSRRLSKSRSSGSSSTPESIVIRKRRRSSRYVYFCWMLRFSA